MGFPVLFIPGLTGYGSFWRDQVAAFAKKFEVLTHDHRGIGESETGRSRYTIEKLSRDVLNLMDALCIQKAHLVGHSSGGAIAQLLAIEHPDRLASIVLSATWTKADAYLRRVFSLRKELLQHLGPSAYLQAATLFWYPSWWISRNNEKLRRLEAQALAAFPPGDIVASRIDAVLAFDGSEYLGRIKTPTLVIGAEDDLVTPVYFAEELARSIPGAEVKIFPRGGHFLTQVLAREFNAAVLPFLLSHTPA